MKKIFFLIIIFYGLSFLQAQSFSKHFTIPTDSKKYLSDSLKILAVLVDFQEDKYDATIGNGKFGSHYTKNYGDTILDPLPHDSKYFEDHLLFAKNYFKKVSKGKVNISFKVLPDIITVSKTMREYSPGYNSNDLKPLINFSEEVWKLADKKFNDVNFSNYDLFLIFHAGVSSGLDLGIFSIDRNLPSLYLSEKVIKNILGNNFNGFQTKSGFIKNTLIMPETESREVQLIDNSVALIQVTINGLLVANIASHLGLPDLFDTETGKSAIGKFGLMDGQAIIANNGIFPPAPSAWEKIFLGWDNAKEIISNKNKINLVTSEIANLNDTTIIKIPISSSEYFLLENRQQDANKNDLIFTIKNKDKIYNKIIKPDTSGLYLVNPEDLEGVIIDVDEFDAATPGNGIVIWHIDENIINQKINENKINTDFLNKGVKVVEADGIQDIGETFSSFFGTVIGEGSADDFWFKGNKSKFYKNIFSADSKPNTNSNSGAKTYITIESFSDNSNKMIFNVSFESNGIKKILSSKINFLNNQEPKIISLKNDVSYDVFMTDGNDLVKLSSEGKILNRFHNFSEKGNIAGINFQSYQIIIGSFGNIINLYVNNISDSLEKTYNVTSSLKFTSPFVIQNVNNTLLVFGGTEDGKIVKFDLFDLIKNGNQAKFEIQKIFNNTVLKINLPFNSFDNYFSAVSENEYYNNQINSVKNLLGKVLKIVTVKNSENEFIDIILVDLNDKYEFQIYNNEKLINSFNVIAENKLSNFSVGDLFNDGNCFIIFNNNNKIIVYDINGILLNNFPYELTNNKKLTSTSLIVDLNNDNVQDILAVSNNGELIAVDSKTAKLIDGFPIKVANSSFKNFIIYEDELPTMGPIPKYKPVIITIDQENYFSVWNISPIQGKSFWNYSNGNSTNNSFVEITNKRLIANAFFPLEKVYNWPNPVYGNSTNIRFYVSEDSNVAVKIFDLAGETVANLESNAKGGYENEIVWDVTKIPSGIYYANIYVESNTKKTASKNIKIAVIK